MATEVNVSGWNTIIPQTSADFKTYGYPMPGSGMRLMTDANMRQTHEMFNLWTSDGLDAAKVMDNFNRFYQLYPEMELPGNLKSYVFITRPDLNIFSSDRSNVIVSENQNDNLTVSMARTDPEVLHMLTKNYSSKHDFISYLQGRTLSLQLPDFQIKTTDFTTPFYAFKYTYPTVTNESTTGGTFDITFREDGHFRISKLFYYWIYYMDAVNKDIMKVSSSNLKDNRFDYMCSVYEFICDPTSEWVLFWTKYTGCVPTAVPISNFSHSLGDQIDNKVGITFSYIRTESWTPDVLSDFNRNVQGGKNSYSKSTLLPLWNNELDLTGASIAGCPMLFIATDGKVLLKWLPMESWGTAKTVTTQITPQVTQNAQNKAYTRSFVGKAATAPEPTRLQKKMQTSANKATLGLYSSMLDGVAQGLFSNIGQGYKR